MAALCEPLTSVLRSARADFNAYFTEARRIHPTLDATEFSAFVKSHIDPLIAAIDSVRPDAVFDVATASWEIALDLVGQRLAGPAARHPWIGHAWLEVLPRAPAIVVASPRRVIGSLSNAAHQIAITPGARSRQWLDLMTRLAGLTNDAEVFLKAGQVAAWRSGLAHYRSGALATGAELPESIALAALETSGHSWPDLQNRLAADPWHLPDGPSASPVVRAGAFRGFGGLFTEPPRVAIAQDQLIVLSSGEGWVLTADAFGATFHRATPEEVLAAQFTSAQPSSGSPIPSDIGSITSCAILGRTLAVTGSLTHAVLLFPLA